MPVHVVEAADGRVLGTVDAAAAHSSVHRGAVHLHRAARTSCAISTSTPRSRW
jgi:hypothetical protein